MPLLSIQDTKFVWREVNLNVTAWSMFAIENWFTKLQRDSKRVTALVSPISSHSITNVINSGSSMMWATSGVKKSSLYKQVPSMRAEHIGAFLKFVSFVGRRPLESPPWLNYRNIITLFISVLIFVVVVIIIINVDLFGVGNWFTVFIIALTCFSPERYQKRTTVSRLYGTQIFVIWILN